MQPERDLAIILKTVIYEERHRIVTALTENHGVISALARNSIQSRRFGGTLEPFTASEWLFAQKPGADLARLEEASIRRSFEGLRADFERLSIASVMNEMMLRTAPRYEPCPDLFRLHSNALAWLEDEVGTLRAASPSPALRPAPPPGTVSGEDLSLLNGYLTKLLQWSGNQPQLGACMSCAIPIQRLSPEASLTCIVADAGWICPECRTHETRHVRDREGQYFSHAHLKLTPGAVRDFHQSLSLPIRQIPSSSQASRVEHLALFRFLEALFVYHMPGYERAPLKSLRFLDLSEPVRRAANPYRQS